jgi:hypothetical protein
MMEVLSMKYAVRIKISQKHKYQKYVRYKSFEAFTAMKSSRGLSRVRVDLISQRFEECPCVPHANLQEDKLNSGNSVHQTR